MGTTKSVRSGVTPRNLGILTIFRKEQSITTLSFVLFAIILVGLAAVILSVIAGDVEFITRPQGRIISTTALTLAVASGVILTFLSFLAAPKD